MVVKKKKGKGANTTPANDATTEEKIKQAARVVFQKKGFAATRTRDIAQEAGINLALLNYYFRSKQKLFELIMFETLNSFLQFIKLVLNDEKLTLEKKIDAVVSSYIDKLTERPDLPLFILSELRSHPQILIDRMEIKGFIMKSHFAKQLRQGISEGKIADIHPFHFIINIMGMTVFPFLGSPLLKAAGGISDKKFIELMIERKKLVPQWIKLILNPR